MDCFSMDFISYPPVAMISGTAGVPIGVMKAVKHAACTNMISPIGLAPKLLQAWIVIGMKISITARFCITCVNRNGTIKKTVPIK